MNERIERDSLGEVRVPADKYWGAQTERSRQNFRIGKETMPLELIYAYAELKKRGGHRQPSSRETERSEAAGDCGRVRGNFGGPMG